MCVCVYIYMYIYRSYTEDECVRYIRKFSSKYKEDKDYLEELNARTHFVDLTAIREWM